jgi:hypothetical protein
LPKDYPEDLKRIGFINPRILKYRKTLETVQDCFSMNDPENPFFYTAASFLREVATGWWETIKHLWE